MQPFLLCEKVHFRLPITEAYSHTYRCESVTATSQGIFALILLVGELHWTSDPCLYQNQVCALLSQGSYFIFKASIISAALQQLIDQHYITSVPRD
jgi:hypothetical protein